MTYLTKNFMRALISAACVVATTVMAPAQSCDGLWLIRWFRCDHGNNNQWFVVNRDGSPICGGCSNCPTLPCWSSPIVERSHSEQAIRWTTSSGGRIQLVHDRDVQVYGSTWLFTTTPVSIPVPLVGDIPGVWLNDTFVGRGSPAVLNLSVGWNHLEFTSYNQNQGTPFELNYEFLQTVRFMGSERCPLVRADFRLFGTTQCPGSRGPLVLGSIGTTLLGSPFAITLDRAPAQTSALLIMGASDTMWQGLRLPFALGSAAPGCSLVASAEGQFPLRTNALGQGAQYFTIPPDVALLGSSIFFQWLAVDPPANRLGLTTSPGGHVTIGNYN